MTEREELIKLLLEARDILHHDTDSVASKSNCDACKMPARIDAALAADQVNAEGRNGARDGSPEWVPEQYRKTAGGQIVGWKSLMCESKGGSDCCMHCGRDMAGYYANRPPCEVLERRRLAMIPDEMVQAFGCRNEAFHAANGGPTEGEVCKKWCKQPCCPVSFKEKP